MARFRAVVFDVGGTLIYPSEPIGETYARIGRGHGLKLVPEATTAAFRLALKSSAPRAVGTIPSDGNDRAWWKQVVRASLPDPSMAESANFEAFFEELYLHYAKAEAWSLFPEVMEVLQALRDYPVELVALSNWDGRLHAVLDGLGLGEFLVHRFISAELGWEKPDAAIYRHVAEVLKLAPHSLLSVGDDRVNDVDGARKAGWEAILIDRPKTDLWAVVKTLSGGKKARRAR